MHNQAVMDEYLEFLRVTEHSYIVTEQEYLMEAISPDALVQGMKKKVDYIEKHMRQLKVNVNQLKAQGKKMGGWLKKQHKMGKSPEQVNKVIVDSMARTIKPHFAKLQQKFQQRSAGEKVLIGLAAFLVILYINSMIGSVAVLVAGQMAGQVITAVVIAPIVEEAAKAYFIQQGLPWIGTGVVFTIEAAMYIFTMLAMGTKLITAVLTRALALLFHFSTTYVQKNIVDKGKASGEDTAFAGWLIGVGMHAAWNTMAVVVAYKTGGMG